MSRRMKQLAQQNHVPVLALAQLNRAVEKENREPRLSDLRESGSLEQDADRVWLLHQDEDAIPTGHVWPVKLIQAKCRGGATNRLDIGFKKITTRFEI